MGLRPSTAPLHALCSSAMDLTPLGVGVSMREAQGCSNPGLKYASPLGLNAVASTAYKQKLFDILTEHATTAMRAGELVLGTDSEQLSFTMLMEDSWQQKLDSLIR